MHCKWQRRARVEGDLGSCQKPQIEREVIRQRVHTHEIRLKISQRAR